MKTISELTLADLKAMKLRPEVLAFAKACGGDMQKFWDTCPNGYWLICVLRQTGQLSELDARKIGLAYAKKVLPAFEKINPLDNGPRLCLKAVEVFLKNPTVANQQAMINAAYLAHSTYTAYAAAAAAYYAAYYPSGIASADYAVHFATGAADIIKANYAFASSVDEEVRKKFEQWGANKVRTIVQRSAPKSKIAKPRPKPSRTKPRRRTR